MTVDPVDEDIGLDNRDKDVLLVNAGLASQAMCGLIDGAVDGGVICHVDVEGRAPFGKLGPVGVVGNTIIVKAIGPLHQVAPSFPHTRDLRR